MITILIEKNIIVIKKKNIKRLNIIINIKNVFIFSLISKSFLGIIFESRIRIFVQTLKLILFIIVFHIIFISCCKIFFYDIWIINMICQRISNWIIRILRT